MKEIVGERLKTLRKNADISQTKLSFLMGLTQSSVNRYENNQAEPPYDILIWYADYFDVSVDYILGRTDNPQGKVYKYEPDFVKDKIKDKDDWNKFVEMCFEPDSPMNAKLKEAILKMAGGEND